MEKIDKNLLPSTSMMKMKQGWAFQRETMIPNTAKETLNWFQRKKVTLLEWPANHLT